MKTILVTGGAGFIGSHLCDALVEKNRVICVDNLFTGNKENIKHLIDNKNFEIIEHDIIEPLFIDKPIDQIYNLVSSQPEKFVFLYNARVYHPLTGHAELPEKYFERFEQISCFAEGRPAGHFRAFELFA